MRKSKKKAKINLQEKNFCKISGVRSEFVSNYFWDLAKDKRYKMLAKNIYQNPPNIHHQISIKYMLKVGNLS